ncbi:BQ5605_C010g05899 [Microbotryum silenes-dioicae]|uniref:DNA topoisomerase I n=1 Tax=Microbotryum silenes-dioicae TaxID=796604 RepID=A0A2X0LU57_9BASI|nr:BQ5605_C010g05899 [Microbotryum silenes-dioicae]
MTDAAAAPKYKKRVIQESSSDESGDEDDVPLNKRPRPELSSNGHHAAIGNGSYAPVAPAPVVEMKDGAKTSASASTATMSDLLFAAAAAASADSSTNTDKKISVFTTGDSDDDDDDDGEDDAPLASKQKKQAMTTTTKKINNGYQSDSDSESDHAALEAQVKKHVAKEAMVSKQVEKLSKRVDREEADDDNSSEDEKPLATKAKVKAKSATTKKAGAPRASSSKSKASKRKNDASDDEEQDDDEEDSDQKPMSKKTKKAPAKKGTKSAPTSKKATPVQKGSAASKVDKKLKKEDSITPAKLALNKGKGKDKYDDDEDVKTENGDGEEGAYKWWEDQSNDGTTKWKTLEHNGVMFPPEYEPHGVKMKYEGKPVDLPPEAEEVASFFAAILETDYVKNPVFVKNFFDSWLGVLKAFPPRDGTKITTFEKCDFTPIFAHLETAKAKKKEMTATQKKEAKAIRDITEEPYKTCLLDGRKEKVGNFRIEPPALFRGRGEHPKTGLLKVSNLSRHHSVKTRVRPEQITINIGKDAKVPTPPAGHHWKSVVHDDTVTWLATWKENVNGNVKYVFLAAGSSLKGQSDLKKFEKARALKDHVARIRRDYTADLKDKEMVVRQRATAIYLIDRFALRNGNEKGEDEADTVGCCSLRFEHVTLTPPTKVTFDFLGKDSIRYVNEVEVDEQVFKNLKIFKKEPKTIGDLLFDRLSCLFEPSQTSTVNKYLNSYMDGLTAKVFRTYNASYTFQEQLKDTPADGSIADKILAYNRANRLVAVLCNHQRSVSKGHGQMMDRMTDKIRALKYQRKKLRCALLNSPEKKKYKQYKEDESDIEDDWIISHEEQLVVLEREKIKKRFEKENLKRAEADEKPLPASELKQRLEAADELEKTLKAERKKGWKETRYSDEKLIAQIEKMDERILVAKTAATDRDEGKEVSLGTSKINYIDSRITIAWCKKHDVPLNKVFSKTLVDKFTWALDTPADFVW